MWSDNSHTHSFPHTAGFSHAPGLDRLCLNSRLGCVLANGLRDGGRLKFAPHSAAFKDTTPAASSTQVSAEAAIFVAVIVVFYAAIIVILLGTNMRRPSSSSSRHRRSRRSRSRSRSRPGHQVVLDPKDGSVSTQQTPKKKRDLSVPTVPGAHNV